MVEDDKPLLENPLASRKQAQIKAQEDPVAAVIR